MDHDVEGDPVSYAELLRGLEFGCWVAAAVIPILFFVNGPAVSKEQSLVRILLTAMSLTGGISLWLWRRRRRIS